MVLPLTSILNIDLTKNRLIHVKEGHFADANFIITYIMKDILANEDDSLLLMMLHNTIGHYQNIGKRLNFDLLKKVEKKEAVCINILQDVGALDEDLFFSETRYNQMLNKMEAHLANLEKRTDSGLVFLVIDDLSHFVDLGITMKQSTHFLNFLSRLLNNDRYRVVVANHCHKDTSDNEVKLSSFLNYTADVNIAVSALETGVCSGVSGIIKVTLKDREDEGKAFHFKTFDREVSVFNPGSTLAALR